MHIILVHLGKHFPDHIFDCIEQIRIFNSAEECSVHLLVQTDNYEKLKTNEKIYNFGNVKIVNCDLNKQSLHHREFNKSSHLDRNYRDGFWHLCAERFFSMYDYLYEEHLTDVIHMEYDNLLFINLEKYLNLFREKYNFSGGIVDSNTHCLASFMYFKNSDALFFLLQFMCKHISYFSDEMKLLGAYCNNFQMYIGKLPVLTKEYASKLNCDADRYCNNIEDFNIIFDGRCIGQYICGVDPRNEPGDTCGFVNKEVAFMADQIDINWQKVDDKYVPFACGVQVANLHVHSKDLRRWMSNRN